jgi:hypothetical protein
MCGPLEFAFGKCSVMENFHILVYPMLKLLTKSFTDIAWKLLQIVPEKYMPL